MSFQLPPDKFSNIESQYWTVKSNSFAGIISGIVITQNLVVLKAQ